MPARALRLGIADDHELLAQLALQLDPVVAAARTVGAAQTLADHAFETELAGAGQQVAGVFRERRGEPQRVFVAPFQQRLQARAALLQGDIAQILAFVVRQVEEDVQDVLAATFLEGVLQGLEVRSTLLVEDDQFAVQPTALQTEPGQGLLQVRQAFGPVMAVAGQQAHVAVFDAAHQPIAVQLEFVGPLPSRRLLDQAGQLGGDPLEHRRLPPALAASRRPGRGRGGFAMAGQQRTLAEHAVGTLLQHVEAIQAARLAVLGLDQEPLGLLAAQVGADQVPTPGEFLAIQGEAEMALFQALARIVQRRPGASVPDDDIAGAVVPLGDAAFEIGIVQRMVLNLHREPLHRRVEARPLGHRPALQGAIQLQAEVVVQAAGVVLLDAIAEQPGAVLARLAAAGLRGLAEIALAGVLGERLAAGHGGLLGAQTPGQTGALCRTMSMAFPSSSRVTGLSSTG